jgi:hypothetical protein
MGPRLVWVVAGATLIGGLGPATGGPSDGPSADLQTVVTAAGQVLGAATACDDIPQTRVEEAAASVGQFAQDTAASPEELAAAHAVFAESVQRGGDAVASGRTGCDQVTAALAKLEEAFRP